MYVYIICICLQRNIKYCSFAVPERFQKHVTLNVDIEPLIWSYLGLLVKQFQICNTCIYNSTYLKLYIVIFLVKKISNNFFYIFICKTPPGAPILVRGLLFEQFQNHNLREFYILTKIVVL